MAKGKKKYNERFYEIDGIAVSRMTAQELRFMSVYLSMLDKDDYSTRFLKLPLEDFEEIMDLDPMDRVQLEKATDHLLMKIVTIPRKSGGFTSFQLFKHCRLHMDEFFDWYVEFDAHDDALPLMLEFKEKYFSHLMSAIDSN